MTPEKFKDLLERYSQGNCSAEEARFVEQWYESIESGEPVVPASTEERLWDKISRNTGVEATSRYLLLKYAASLAFIIVLSLAAFFKLSRPDQPYVANSVPPSTLPPLGTDVVVSNETSSVKEVALADGSRVILEPMAVIRIPKQFAPKQRVVVLTGEAFFDIERDTLRPFFVYSGEVVTKVLGTSFSIKALDTEKQIIVSVKTGKVSVFTNPNMRTAEKSEVILTPNQQAIYDRMDIVVTKELVSKPEIILEKPTLFKMQFEEAPVAELFALLEENYGVDIQFDAAVLKDCVLKTNLNEEGLFERLEVICKAIGATYSEENAVIHIRGSGCQ
jgi:transmembrane sensor